MNDKAKALLERVIKLATGVSCLHGRYELGKEGHEELRGIQKEAMGLLKPNGDMHTAPVAHRHFSPRYEASTSVPTEELWHGYRKADALFLMNELRAPYQLTEYSIRNGVAYYGKIRSGYEDGDKELREAGLRRPDEPDYKKLG